MKKLIAILAVLFVIGTVNVFATTGIGVQGGANIGGGGSAAITFKLDSIPWVFAVDGAFYSNYVALGATADMWLANPKISKVLNWYYGWGVSAGVGLGDPLALNVGARALVGINAFLLDGVFELYLQAAWQPTLAILPEIGFDLVNFPVVGGFRFWF